MGGSLEKGGFFSKVGGITVLRQEKKVKKKLKSIKYQIKK